MCGKGSCLVVEDTLAVRGNDVSMPLYTYRVGIIELYNTSRLIQCIITVFKKDHPRNMNLRSHCVLVLFEK